MTLTSYNKIIRVISEITERMAMYELIERINEAADVKKFTVDELDKLAVEIR